MTTKIKNSRTPEIDVEKIVENVGGNRYFAALAAAQLARKNLKGVKFTDHYVNPGMNALLEIQSGKFGGK